MLRIFTKPRRKLRGGQYAPDLLPHFSILRGSTSAGLSQKTNTKNRRKSNFLTGAGGSA